MNSTNTTHPPQNNKIESPEADYLYFEDSQIENAGNGLFTAIDIYEGEVISLFTGEILSDEIGIPLKVGFKHSAEEKDTNQTTKNKNQKEPNPKDEKVFNKVVELFDGEILR